MTFTCPRHGRLLSCLYRIVTPRVPIMRCSHFFSSSPPSDLLNLLLFYLFPGLKVLLATLFPLVVLVFLPFSLLPATPILSQRYMPLIG